VLDVPSDLDITVDFPENYVASNDRDTTGHGTRVLDILSCFAPNSSYKPFRLIAEDEEFRPSNFLKAMDDVRNANIDVVNISAGKYHGKCGGQCRICEAVEDVTREGSIVVAGAGNRKENNSFDVFCPARSSRSIAVGMSETLCSATPPQNPLEPLGKADTRPPGAYWIDPHSEIPYHPDEAYCSYERCSPHQKCENNRQVIYWEGNVDWSDYIPEVVAPGHKPLVNVERGMAEIEPGTSYSTAVVSGGIATVMSEVFPNLPSPQSVKRAVEATSQDLNCGIVGKFDMKGLRDALV